MKRFYTVSGETTVHIVDTDWIESWDQTTVSCLCRRVDVPLDGETGGPRASAVNGFNGVSVDKDWCDRCLRSYLGLLFDSVPKDMLAEVAVDKIGRLVFGTGNSGGEG